MGRVITPKYRIEQAGLNLHPTHRLTTSAEWDVRAYGRPTRENIARFVEAQTRSFMSGGPNHSLAEEMGYLPVPSRVRVVEQKSGRVVAEWEAPAFMALPEPVDLTLEEAAGGGGNSGRSKGKGSSGSGRGKVTVRYFLSDLGAGERSSAAGSTRKSVTVRPTKNVAMELRFIRRK